MNGNLSIVTSSQKLEDGSFLLNIPDGWHQGRGAFGGLVLGAMVRAVLASEHELERRLRSVSGELMGPVTVGPATIHVQCMRHGNGVSNWRVYLMQAEQLLANASVILGRTRGQDREWMPCLESLAPWSLVETSAPSAPFAPEFTQFFEFRPTGPLPFSGHPVPETSGWIRPRLAVEQLLEPEIIALADAWWPGSFVLESAPRPASTIAFHLQLFQGVSLYPAEPLYHRGHSIAAHDGYSVDYRELWSPNGQLVALNQQTIAHIR